MSTQIQFTFNDLATDYCFTTPQQLALDIVNGLSGSLLGDSSQFTVSIATPSTDNQDRPWLRLNADGSPDRLYYFWQGQWCSLHQIPQSSSVRKIWVGTTGELETFDGGASGTVTDTTGPMWEEDTEMAARFPFGVGTTANETVITVKGTGGEDEHTLTIPELPAHTHDSYGDGSSKPLEQTGGDNFGTNPTTSTGGDEPHNNLPPYYGVYFIKRTARRFYVAS